MQIDEYLYGDGICVVEWADKADKSFPKKSLTIDFSFLSENQRRIKIEWESSRLDMLGNEITKCITLVD